MIATWKVIFLILACICFLVAAWSRIWLDETSRYGRFNLIAAGLFFAFAREMLTVLLVCLVMKELAAMLMPEITA